MKRQMHALGILILVGVWALARVNAEGKEEAMAVFSMSDKGETRITVKAGQFFSLKLITSPGTGYGWILAAPANEKMLSVVEKKNEAPDTNFLGASEIEFWICQALCPGQSELVLKYVRPWEKDKEPAKKHVFKVLIQ